MHFGISVKRIDNKLGIILFSVKQIYPAISLSHRPQPLLSLALLGGGTTVMTNAFRFNLQMDGAQYDIRFAYVPMLTEVKIGEKLALAVSCRYVEG